MLDGTSAAPTYICQARPLIIFRSSRNLLKAQYLPWPHLCMIWRCKLLSSTSSLSTMPILPTPAAARYSAAGEPRPPAPTISTEPRHSLDWAAGVVRGAHSVGASSRLSDLRWPNVGPLLGSKGLGGSVGGGGCMHAELCTLPSTQGRLATSSEAYRALQSCGESAACCSVQSAPW
jgi:hypothetical protein